MHPLYFRLSEFLRAQTSSGWHRMVVPSNRTVLDNIVGNHLYPLNVVRGEVNRPLKVTRGYATVEYERSKGRDGTSQHCYKQHQFGEKRGATDVDFFDPRDATRNGYLRFADYLSNGPWYRICWYPDLTFFHIDYKADYRQYFVQKSGEWEFSASKQMWLTEIDKSFNETS